MTPDLRQQGRFLSLGHAWRGIRWMLSTQINARIHLVATLLVIAVALTLNFNAYEWAFLLLAISLVWVAEAINTAIESLADALHPEHHPLIGRAKDIAAGGVLISSIGALAIAVLVLLQRYA